MSQRHVLNCPVDCILTRIRILTQDRSFCLDARIQLEFISRQKVVSGQKHLPRQKVVSRRKCILEKVYPARHTWMPGYNFLSGGVGWEFWKWIPPAGEPVQPRNRANNSHLKIRFLKVDSPGRGAGRSLETKLIMNKLKKHISENGFPRQGSQSEPRNKANIWYLLRDT